jgi:hypothetical protein
MEYEGEKPFPPRETERARVESEAARSGAVGLAGVILILAFENFGKLFTSY